MLGEPDEAKSSHRITGASWWYRALVHRCTPTAETSPLRPTGTGDSSEHVRGDEIRPVQLRLVWEPWQFDERRMRERLPPMAELSLGDHPVAAAPQDRDRAAHPVEVVCPASYRAASHRREERELRR